MPVTVIPFKMPEPTEIPAHLSDTWSQMAPGDAVARAMDLLLQIDAAQTIVYEVVDGDGNLALGQVVSQGGAGEPLGDLLAKDPQYGQSVTGDAPYLTGRSQRESSPLLVMGQADAGEVLPFSPGLAHHLFDGEATGNAGFIYVLPLTAETGRPLGWLTLLRPASAGPLNHEQPNIAEGLRRLLAGLLTEASA